MKNVGFLMTRLICLFTTFVDFTFGFEGRLLVQIVPLPAQCSSMMCPIQRV